MLYTGKGDGGTTKVLDSKERIPKSSALPEALGTLDELNSFVGVARAHALAHGDLTLAVGGDQMLLSALLHEIQQTLFIVQAEVAGAPMQVSEGKRISIEVITNAIEVVITPLKGFSIAGGTEFSALLDVARTLARRAERRLVGLEESGLRTLGLETKAYMNRLSSVLFAFARYVNHANGIAEEIPSYK